MPKFTWSGSVAAVCFALAACSSSPAANKETPFIDPEDPVGPPAGAVLTGSLTVEQHVVWTGVDADSTTDHSLRLEVRMKPSADGEWTFVDAGSTYSYTGSYVEHSVQGEHAICITDNYSNATGSGAVGSGLDLSGSPSDTDMQLTASVDAHATGHNKTVCDGVLLDLASGDTSDDTTVHLGCPSGDLEAEGTLTAGYDFACTIESTQGVGQTIVSGVLLLK